MNKCQDCRNARDTIFENRWICDIDGKIVFDEVCSEYIEQSKLNVQANGGK